MDGSSYLWPAALSAAVAFMAWLGSRAVKRVDQHEQDIEQLKREAITRPELKADLAEYSKSIVDAIHRVQDDVEKGNRDVITRIGAVDAKADRANTRLDQLKDEEISRLRFERDHVA